MSTTYIPPGGINNPLTSFVQATQTPVVVPVAQRSVIPPLPLPQTEFGTNNQTSYST